VYQMSHFNIAASSAKNGQGELFFDRNSLIVKPCYIGTSWTGKIPKRLSCCYNNDWKYLLDNEPLNIRAWVPQGRMLSQRICHFTRSQVIWECSESWACERFPAERQATPTNRVLKSSDIPHIMPWHHDERWEYLYGCWWEINLRDRQIGCVVRISQENAFHEAGYFKRKRAPRWSLARKPRGATLVV
jgi:hypothetical protein